MSRPAATVGTTPRVTPGSLRELGLPAWVFSRAAGRVMGTAPPAVFTTLARTRRTFWGWLGYSAGLMPFGHLPRRDTELVILRIADRRASAYEWRHHERLGRRVGLSRAEIDRVRTLGTDGWHARQTTMLTAVDQLLSDRDLSDENWAALRAHLDERESIELLLLVAQYDGLASVLHTLRLAPDPPRRT